MKKPLYLVFSSILESLVNCEKNNNQEWIQKRTDKLRQLNQELPSGSGFDNGSYLLRPPSNPQKLVFSTSFHHMNDSGHYTEWTEHTVTVTPIFGGFDLSVSEPKWRNARDIKDHIAESFYHALMREVEE